MQTSFAVSAAVAILSMTAIPAHADAASAAHNFFTNLSRVGITLNLTEQSAKVENTLVHGMYALLNRNGEFAGYINEAGTLLGDASGMKILPTVRGQDLRKMTPEEVSSFRTEIMHHIDYDKLVKVNYGAGNDRKQLMFSAVDCGYCQRLEQSLDKDAGKVNTTFYVVPMSLKSLKNGGAMPMQTVSKIWCAEDKGAAWKNYWKTMQAPAASPACAFDPKTAETQQNYLVAIFKAAGMTINATPTFVREDGSVIRGGGKMGDAAAIGKTFGGEASALLPADPRVWLVAGAPSAAAEAAPAQQQPKKVNLNNALKSLFN